jgi:hypothetical protein
MKPTPRLSSHGRSLRGDIRGSPGHGAFPLTDYNFQSGAEACAASGVLPGKTGHVSQLRTFRKLSSEFLGTETSRDFLKEAILFTVIAAISAWPIGSMFAAMERLVR